MRNEKRVAAIGPQKAPDRAAWLSDEQVVAVDCDDNEIGGVSRAQAHGSTSVMHRAFMVLLADDAGRFLLTRRSEHKRLWPGVWADSCAGHPRVGEDVVEAAERRIREELGCHAQVEPFGRFQYQAHYLDRGCEHELCHVLIGRHQGSISPDPDEVAETRAFPPEQLVAYIDTWPRLFAPWLVRGLEVFPAESLSCRRIGPERALADPVQLDPRPSLTVR